MPTPASAVRRTRQAGRRARRGGQPVVKWLQLSRTPRALTLHLKRFRTVGKSVHKIDTHVPFPARLEIGPYACAVHEPPKSFGELRRRVRAEAPTMQRAAPLELYGA